MKKLLFGLVLLSTVVAAHPGHHRRSNPNVLHVGQNVIYTQSGTHYHARILEIFEDGKVRVAFPSGEFADSDVGVRTLSRSLDFEGGFQVGEKIVYTQSGSHYNARILELFEDSKARIKFPSGEFADSDVELTTISKPLGSTGNIQIGNSVIYTQSGSHYHARVLEIFSDGQVRVSFPSGEFADSDVKALTLSKTLQSSGEFFPGEDVVYTQSGSHYNARIIEIFADGQVRVNFPSGEFADSDVALNTLSLSRRAIRR